MKPATTRLGTAACCLLLLAGGPGELAAQDSLPPWQGGMTTSLGQPARTRHYAGASGGIDWRDNHSAAVTLHAMLGATRPLINPIASALSFSAEGYAGLRATEFDAGVRALFQMPIFRLTFGADYNIPDQELGFMLGISAAVRRGGVFGGGSLLRAEWGSAGVDALRASVLVPVAQRNAGRTRPSSERVALSPRASQSTTQPPSIHGVDAPLANLRVAAQRIHDLVVPYLDGPGADPRAAVAPVLANLRNAPALPGVTGPGLQVEGVVNAYHLELRRAFAIATSEAPLSEGGTTVDGDSAAALARRALLDHVLYPYNRLLGQWKTPGTLRALTAYARGSFARTVVSASPEAAAREPALLYVFEQLLNVVLELERNERRQWRDSRVVWLPLQLGLRPKDHDTQSELDAILEAAVGVRFTDGNRVWYIINEEFQTEVIRSIKAARDYHVVWIHDFRGRNAEGEPDELSLRYVVDTYFNALAQHIRAYDQRRRLPIYMIFIDELYYNSNKARLWFDLLENPLNRKVKLPKGFEALEESIRAGQRELAAAVAGSRLLQAETQQYGEAWLLNQVKVHVNVTNPTDDSFWSRQVIPLLGMPDNYIRDHRKIVFYDISEDDPYAGLAIYTGMGIGEHYVGPRWEDRAIMVQGPAVLTLKLQARRLLESHGISSERMPYPLRPRSLAPDYQAAIASEVAQRRNSGGRDQRALELHNQTGFLEKQVSVAKATLYSLMPAGAVIKVPDSLWGSSLFAALLSGSALRGCRVLFIAPSLAAAPSAGAPQMALAHDLIGRLIVLQQELGPELEAVGGMLKTGIYNPGIGVDEIGPRFANAYLNARRTPFLRRLFPVDPSVDTLLTHISEILPAAKASGRLRTGSVVMPKLHLKANFFATREAFDSLVARPEMMEVLTAYITQLTRTEPTQFAAPLATNDLAAASERLEASFRSLLKEQDRERVVYYLMIGSANADNRSLYLDGEASVLLSGWSGVVGLIDFSLIANLSVWIDDLEMLDALLPAPSGLMRAVARRIRPML